MTGKVSDTHLSSKKDKSLGLVNYDLSLELSRDRVGSYSDSCTNNEFNNNPKLDEDNKRLSSVKRKQRSLFNIGLMYKKRKHYLKQRST
jgi:hypothetical protein